MTDENRQSNSFIATTKDSRDILPQEHEGISGLNSPMVTIVAGSSQGGYQHPLMLLANVFRFGTFVSLYTDSRRTSSAINSKRATNRNWNSEQGTIELNDPRRLAVICQHCSASAKVIETAASFTSMTSRGFAIAIIGSRCSQSLDRKEKGGVHARHLEWFSLHPRSSIRERRPRRCCYCCHS